jgi:hypothetical protein
MTTRKTMVVPCIVYTWLYRFALSSVPFGAHSCTRMSRASKPPIIRNTSAVAPYMMPIFL